MRGYDSVISFCTIITTAERKQCPDDGIGIRVGLRSQILGVRVSLGAPY